MDVKSDSPVYPVVILKRIYIVILGQRAFQLIVQSIVRDIPYAEYVHSEPAEAVAEISACDRISR